MQPLKNFPGVLLLDACAIEQVSPAKNIAQKIPAAP
jgi:hypothetical protein